MPVERRCGLVFGMNGKRVHPNDISNLQGALQSIQKKAGTHTPPLPFTMHGKPCQNEERYRMARHGLSNPAS